MIRVMYKIWGFRMKKWDRQLSRREGLLEVSSQVKKRGQKAARGKAHHRHLEQFQKKLTRL